MANRQIVYPGAIPLDTDILTIQRNLMIALGYLAQATLGTSVVADGLACTQQTVPNMTVQIAPGSIISLTTVDATAFGSLNADTTDPLVKMGINTSTVVSSSFGTITAPGTTGQSINYLIQAAFQESDGVSVVLPYYNSTNPAIAYSGPMNSGLSQNTVRAQTVNLGLKAGTAATTGSQTTPTPDSGYVGLWVITVAYGQSSITNSNISLYSGAPFIPAKLGPAMLPGFSNMQAFTSSGTFTVPAGVTRVKVTVIGGGGGAGYNSTYASGGGGSGGRSVGVVTGLTQGQQITVTVGAGGTSPGTAGNGTGGGTSSFGSYITATGGGGGTGGTGTANAGGAPGTSSGGTVNDAGEYGLDGSQNNASGIGNGGKGGGPGGGRGTTGFATGYTAQGYGGGGGGGGCGGGGGATGGNGKSGIVIVEW